MDSQEKKYKMSIDLNVLNHLGLNLYSNTPAVLSEVVANSYDADATEVRIKISQEDDEIVITDNGNGMNITEINEKFLCVGYQKRKHGEAYSRKFHRPVMGRKGIGKLSLLSIADTIEIHTKTEGKSGNAFLLSKADLEREIEHNQGVYFPKNIEFVDFAEDHGTRIIIRDFKRDINRTPSFLRPRLARRFSLKPQIGEDRFSIFIEDTPISIEDRDFFSKANFIWFLGDTDDLIISKYPNLRVQGKLNSSIDGTSKATGWIATVNKPSDLKSTEGDNNNKISVICRGKLAQEDILAFYNEGGLYANYIIGEINADFLDDDDERDIATSNRQQFIENDERFQKLKVFIFSILKVIQKQWTSLRNDMSVEYAIQEIPSLEIWYNSYTGDAKMHAKKLFATIENMHFDKDVERKKEIYKFGILAFERLRVSDKLSQLEELTGESIYKFGNIFSEIEDIEATLYYDIASQRVNVIKAISQACDNNEKEKVLQKYIFKNLWLLDASWDRATEGSELMEQRVTTAFNNITVNLTKEEQNGRLDIKYRTSAGKHIIIELKRYIPSYKITAFSLGDQIDKYINALKKCLISNGEPNPFIEAICIIGPNTIDDLNRANDIVAPVRGRIITYDQLIEHSLNSYKDYLERNKEVGKIRKLINEL